MYVSLLDDDDTERTEPGTPSTIISFVFANEPVESGSGNVNSALLPAASFTDPLLNANELFET